MSATIFKLNAVFSQGRFCLEAAKLISKAAAMKK